jgi:hypothetical protein
VPGAEMCPHIGRVAGPRSSREQLKRLRAGRSRRWYRVVSMGALKAVVKNGRLVLDEPTDLPEGAEVEVAVVLDEDDAELLAELDASADDEDAGRLVDMTTVIARLGST